MNIDRNAAAFIDDGNGAIDMDRDLDRAAVTGQVLVDRVVQDLGNAMVQRPLVGAADVHARLLADRLEALQLA
jgi:hypothetical protein